MRKQLSYSGGDKLTQRKQDFPGFERESKNFAGLPFTGKMPDSRRNKIFKKNLHNSG
jgi:hypothetical protein